MENTFHPKGKHAVTIAAGVSYTLYSYARWSGTLAEFDCSEPDSTERYSRHVATLVVDKEQHDLLIQRAWEGDNATLKAFLICARLELRGQAPDLSDMNYTPTVFAFREGSTVYDPHVRLLTDAESERMSDVYKQKHCPNGWGTLKTHQICI